MKFKEYYKTMIEEINQYLKDLDRFIIKQYNADNQNMIIVFECFDGGPFESKELDLQFNNVVSFHLPRCFNGNIILKSLDFINAKKIIPSCIFDIESYERNASKCFLFEGEDKNAYFYIYCDSIQFKFRDKPNYFK